ncbi:MAG TPA: hypothetical protein VFW62_11670, partial [bacterium]|nr:hypothetical protein [bacterium]
MAKFYLRKIIVTILPPTGKEKILDELRITFRCEKTLESNPNSAQVEIYNLSEKTRSLLEGKKTRLILEAGYDGKTETVFKGNITDVATEKQGPDLVTRVEVTDGGNHFRNARIEKGLPPGAKARQVIDELVKSMDLPRGSITGVPNVQYANGITLSGFSKDRLNDVTRKLGLEWSIQNEAIQIIPRNDTTQESEVLLSP